MEFKELLQQTLKEQFTSVIRSRAQFLNTYSNIHIREQYPPEINATVIGSTGQPYEVSLYVDLERETILMHCGCPFQQNCKHLAALIMNIIDKNKAKNTTSREESFSKKKKASTLSQIVTNEYRELPIKKDLESALEKYTRTSDKQILSWNETVEGEFIAPNELRIYTESSPNSFRYSPQQAKKIVFIKWENKKCYVKCESCVKKMPVLCTHQYSLLMSVHYILEKEKFLSDKFNYDKLTAPALDLVNIEKEHFHKHYQILLTAKGFTFTAKKSNIYTQLEWKEIANDISNPIHEQSMNEEEIILYVNQNQTPAYLWHLSGLHNEEKLTFLQGPKLKTKSGIRINQSKEVSPYKIFSGEILNIAIQFLSALEIADPKVKFNAIVKLFSKNFSLLASICHYINTGDSAQGFNAIKSIIPVQLSKDPIVAEYHIQTKDGLTEIKQSLTVGALPFDAKKIIWGNDIFSATKYHLYLNPSSDFQELLPLFISEDHILIPNEKSAKFIHFVEKIKQTGTVTLEKKLNYSTKEVTDSIPEIRLREVEDVVLFEPLLRFKKNTINILDKDYILTNMTVNKPQKSDVQQLLSFLQSSHPKFRCRPKDQQLFFLDRDSLLKGYWFINFCEACDAAGIELLGLKDLKKFNYSNKRAITSSHVKSGIDWFSVDMEISFGDEKIKPIDWIRAIKHNENFVRLKDDSFGMLPEDWLKRAKKILAVAQVDKSDIKISNYKFNIIDDLFENLDDEKIGKELLQKRKRLKECTINKKYKLPKIVKAKMRPYQLHGFNWLKFLNSSGFGGILADDMGLGKTLQVIALLADQRKAGISLIIVPRSLLFNWAAELDKFCPAMTYLIHHGTGRSKSLKDLLDNNLLITTYDTAVADITLFSPHLFNYIVLDESQAIKNPSSKRYKAIRLLQASHRLTMTGTPIENNTMDLYAQLSFASPGLLNSQNHFRNNFAIPIDNKGDVGATELLRKLIHPFILRRTKEQVAKDLPKKTETVIYCEMGKSQRKLYTNLKRKIKADIESEVQEKGFSKSKFKILDGLLRLRQMCNSPLLVNSALTGVNANSVKIDILLQNLTEELDQHNALVFSQFTSLLAIVRSELDKRNIKYAYLDGSTRDRQGQVEKFMTDNSIQIFLISLKAGNTGLNLTKADYVYIIDPWWNPAAEAQAIDRTHRIGQKNKIFAYKLICKDSIEEKILALQAKKKKLAGDIIRTDEGVIKTLKKEELMGLFD